MVRVRVLCLIVGGLIAASCGGSDGEEGNKASSVTTTTSSSTTETTETAGGDIPPLPTPLPVVEDPGSIDPILGDFPVDQSRDVQYAWVALAPTGREFTGVLRRYAADEATPQSLTALTDQPESSIYVDGVLACTLLRENWSLDEVVQVLGEPYQEAYELTDAQVAEVGEAILLIAAQVLCPDMEFLLDDPDRFVDTATALRTTLGVASSDLSDADANSFANHVCQEVDRGTTISRMVSDVADQFGYPDDLAEEIVNYVEGTC
jgi:hypothetical protein